MLGIVFRHRSAVAGEPPGLGCQLRRAILFFLLTGSLALPAGAQQAISTGTITGLVRDAQGLAIPGATVEVVNEQTGQTRSTVSSAEGAFNLPALVLGRYTLRVSLTGFSTVEHVGIPLRSNETYDTGVITMTVGGLAETITVEIDAVAVQTATAVRTSVLETAELSSMVARGRDPMYMLNSLPGAIPNLGGFAAAGQVLGGTIGAPLPTIQGTSGLASYVAVDGIGSADGDTGLNNGITSIDSIEEIRVVLNSYSAEYGRNTGPQINVVTKSGGQVYRGSAATYIRHEALNANSPQNERLGLPKPLNRYYTGAFTLGGPVWLPGAGKLENTFFFYTREMWDTTLPANPNTKQMPTALERMGDFSQTVNTDGSPIFIRDPMRGGACSPTAGGPGCFPGNIIPANRINPLGQAILNIFPAPNFFDESVSNRQYNFRDIDSPLVYRTLDQVTVDHNFAQGDRLQVKYRRWRPNREATTGTFGISSNWNHFRSQYAQKEDAITVTHTKTFSSAVVNEASFGFRNTPEVAPLDTMPDPIARLQREPNGLGNLAPLFPGSTNNVLNLYPTVSFSGVPGQAPNINWDARFPIDAVDRRWSLQNNLTWTTGPHVLKAGVYYEHNLNSEGLSAPCFAGCLTFQSSGTTAAQDPFNANHPYANALLGQYTTYSESNVRPFRGGHQWLVEWFGQDSWRAHDRLTLELGVRFAAGTPWHLRKQGWAGYAPPAGQRAAAWLAEAYDPALRPRLYVPTCPPPAVTCSPGARLAMDPVTGQILPNSVALIGQLIPGTGDFYNGMIRDDDPRAFDGQFQPTPGVQAMPRLGFAWDVFGAGRTAIRGGYGITKQLFDASGAFAGTFPLQPPARLQPTLYYGNLSNIGAVPQFFSPQDVVGYALDEATVRTTHNFSVEMQQNVGFNSVVTVAYVGNRQRGLPTARDRNLVPAGARFDPANIDPTTGSVLQDAFLRPIPNFEEVEERTRDGVIDYDSLQVTLNRRVANGVGWGLSYTLSTTKDMQGNLTVFLDPRERLYDYANNDRRHILSYHASWDLPDGSRMWQNPVTRALLDGWQLAGVGYFMSGTPDDVTFQTTDAGGTDTIGGGDPVRITMTCDPHLPRSQRSEDRWFDTSCFARTPMGDYGNASRQMIRQPGDWNLDLSLAKAFAMGGSRKFSVRAEAYNVLNLEDRTVNTTATFDPDGNQVNSDFGRLNLPTGEARVVQLSLRFEF